MDKSEEQTNKKCFCARCFLPVDAEDKVNVEGQSFHRICSMCCICRTTPKALKMFYGHVFCSECFKNHVLAHFKGEGARVRSNSWWMQWAPGSGVQQGSTQQSNSDVPPPTPSSNDEESPKKSVCTRCLQVINDDDMVTVAGQNFHSHCARCYCCQTVPKSAIKVYYGQVFCEECFHKHVMNRNKDNPEEFFRSCFDQWQNNVHFGEYMRDFMSGSSNNSPMVFMMPEARPFCGCGGNAWRAAADAPKKSAVGDAADSINAWELSFEQRPEDEEEIEESCYQGSEAVELELTSMEKIAKLTKYLHQNERSRKSAKKWKNYNAVDNPRFGWVDLQEISQLNAKKRIVRDSDCPKCVWQTAWLDVNSNNLRKVMSCDKNSVLE